MVVQGIRDELQAKRQAILAGRLNVYDEQELMSAIACRIELLCSYRLKSVINATGVIIHTNLGRSILPDSVMRHVANISSGYCNLEYDLEHGSRGKRYQHIQEMLSVITGAEAGIVVNNNAAAVFVSLAALAKGKEVIVSRGELVEIGGSFRIPDVMSASGAILREVGTTNKTHLRDYEQAINEQTALLLKVHQSNFRMVGFTETPSIEQLVALGHKYSIPVMFDLGSGCLIDMKPFGIQDEPTVQEIIKAGVDIVTFSGDKLLGGPQVGVIIGEKRFVDAIATTQLMRAVRVDKMTIAAFEAIIHLYLDENRAMAEIPTLKMLFMKPEEIRKRAYAIMRQLKKNGAERLAEICVLKDTSQSGGGALSEVPFDTYVVSVRPHIMSVTALEAALRRQNPPIIARIKENALLLDARTIPDEYLRQVVYSVFSALE
jgi:L-seryl-tRNA(Ser) seleniumtransferase